LFYNTFGAGLRDIQTSKSHIEHMFFALFSCHIATP